MSMRDLTEQSAEFFAKEWPETHRLWSLIDRWVDDGRLLPVSGTGVRYALPDGTVLHLLDMLPCRDGREPETLRDRAHVGNHVADPADSLYAEHTGDYAPPSPEQASALIAQRALTEQARQRAQKIEAVDVLNAEKKRTAADRLALGRSLYKSGMSGEQLRQAYAKTGEMVALRTAERDLKKIRDSQN